MSNYRDTSEEEFEAALEAAVHARVDGTVRTMSTDALTVGDLIDGDDGQDYLIGMLQVIAQAEVDWPKTRPWQAQTMGHLQTLLREMIEKQVRKEIDPEDVWNHSSDARDQAALDRRGLSTNPATYAARGEAV